MARKVTYVTLVCWKCGKEFQRTLKHHNETIRRGFKTHRCSVSCGGYQGDLTIREVVLSGLHQGMTPYRIARKYRISRDTVYAWKKKLVQEGLIPGPIDYTSSNGSPQAIHSANSSVV